MPDIKLSIAIPTTGMVAMGFAYSLCGLVSYLAANGVKTRPESKLEMSLDIVESSVIHSNREQIVSRAIERNCTDLMFLDHDMVFEPTILDVLMGRRQPVVVTNYMLKQPETDFVAVGLDGERIPTTETSQGMVPIAYSGFGVSLFEIGVFKKTPQPWFMPVFIPDKHTYTTEDNPCFERIRNAGFTVYLDQDASKLITAHVGLKGYSRTEWKPKES